MLELLHISIVKFTAMKLDLMCFIEMHLHSNMDRLKHQISYVLKLSQLYLHSNMDRLKLLT